MWTSVSRGGVILPDGCVDVVWRGDGLVIAGPATGAVESPVPRRGRRSSACASGSAWPARRSACPPWSSPISAWTPKTSWAGARPSAWPRAACPRCSTLVRARLRPVDPLDRAAALAMARPETRVAALGAELGVSERQLRRRFLDAVGLRAEDARPRAALPAVPRSCRGRARRPRAARPRRGLRRPGAPHARGAAALRAARPARARRVRRERGGRTCPFRSSRRRAGRVPSGGMIDRAEAYIWKTARVLEQRRFEVLFKDGDPAAVKAALEPYKTAGRRLRVRAGARRARPDEPAAAHLDRAGGARGRRARPTRACRTTWRRSRRPTAACRSRCRTCGTGRVAPWWEIGDRGLAARHRAAVRAALQARRAPVARAARRRSCGARWTRSTRRTRTRSRRRSRSSTPRPTARGREAAAERLGRARARAGPRRHAARGLLGGRDPPPARLRQARGQPRPRAGSPTRRSTPRSTTSSPARPTHGGWDITWAVWTPAIEIEWSGLVTIAALKTLRSYGRV